MPRGDSVPLEYRDTADWLSAVRSAHHRKEHLHLLGMKSCHLLDHGTVGYYSIRWGTTLAYYTLPLASLGGFMVQAGLSDERPTKEAVNGFLARLPYILGGPAKLKSRWELMRALALPAKSIIARLEPHEA